MNSDLISIVVPIYNVEKYLSECINSIIKQTYDNIELILVDDGSTDSCAKICDEWKEKDDRITVIHKENGGLSDARNVGLERASGEYICFIDSDDYVEIDFVKKLFLVTKKEGVNISQCGIRCIDDSGKELKTLLHKNAQILSGRDAVIESLNRFFVENEVVWNKLYKRELFDNVRFPKGRVHEDEYVVYKLLYNETKIAVINKVLYNYRQSTNSIMRSDYSLKKYNDFMDAYKEKMLFFKDRDKVLYDMTVRSYLSNLSNIYVKIRNNNIIDKAILCDIKKEYRFWYKYVMKSPNISKKNKLKISTFYYSPDFYFALKKARGSIK